MARSASAAIAFAVVLVIGWYAVNGIGPWAGLNEYLGEDSCVRVGENRDGSDEWWCEQGENPHRVRYDRATDSYQIRACTLVQRPNARGSERPDTYSCRDEVG